MLADAKAKSNTCNFGLVSAATSSDAPQGSSSEQLISSAS